MLLTFKILNNHCKILYISQQTWCTSMGHLQEIQVQKVPIMCLNLQGQAALLFIPEWMSTFF